MGAEGEALGKVGRISLAKMKKAAIGAESQSSICGGAGSGMLQQRGSICHTTMEIGKDSIKSE